MRKGLWLGLMITWGITWVVGRPLQDPTLPRFRRVDRVWGIEANGPGTHGVSLLDVNRDGWTDVYVTSFFLAGPRNFNQLFIQVEPGRFKDRASLYGLALHDLQSHDAVWLDFDRDGDFDIFIAASVGRHRLFRQDPDGFTDVSSRAGVDIRETTWARATLAGDVNGDGWVDLFVHNTGTPNQLFINQGDGTFSEEGERRGVGDFREAGIGQGATMVDFDGDGDLDILTCVRSMNPRLFVNRGDGFFTERAQVLGISMPEGCDGGTFVDLNRDGRLDLILINVFAEWARVFYGTKQGTFVERSDVFRVPGLGYTPAVADVDLDGWSDVVVARQDRSLWVALNHRGRTTVTAVVEGVGNDPRGIGMDDLDRDGDPDVAVVHKRDTHYVFRNDTQGDRLWLHVVHNPRRGSLYGTRLTVWDEAGRLYHHTQIVSGYGYLSHSPPGEILIGASQSGPFRYRILFPWGQVLEGWWIPNEEAWAQDFTVACDPTLLSFLLRLSRCVVRSEVSLRASVRFFCEGLPAGATCRFEPDVVPEGTEVAGVTLVVMLSTGIQAGTYPFQVVATNGSVVRWVSMQLEVR